MEAGKLRKLTDKYWQLKQEDPNKALTFYLKHAEQYGQRLDRSLLAYEMEFALQRKEASLPAEPAGNTTLVILVGDSYEPLLQSIWVYRPEKIIAVVNAYYGNKDSRQKGHLSGSEKWAGNYDTVVGLHDWIKMLYDNEGWEGPSMPDGDSIQPIEEDTPTAVFKYLRQQLQDDLDHLEVDQKRVVIDITGAKKTIMAGAFLFAAYADVEISYVEVDEYANDGQGHPYGFMCRFINPVPNPVKDLYLQSWDRARQHFQRYDFSGALAALPEVIEFLDNELTHLRDFLSACAYWMDGLFYQAGTMPLPQELWDQLPKPVHQLASHWPEPGEQRLKESLFENIESILWFTSDELNRIDQLRTQDSLRAAFSRAYALHETLLKAQAVALCVNDQLRLFNDGQEENYAGNEKLKRAIFSWIVHKTDSKQIEDLLTTGQINDWTFRFWLNDNYTDFEVSTAYSVFGTVYFPTDELRKRRNLIVHTYFPVLDHYVEEIINLVNQNLQYYITYWQQFAQQSPNYIDIVTYKYEPTFDRWANILSICGLEEFVTQP